MALDIDRHFRRDDLKRYVMQCVLAGFVVLVLLLVLALGLVLNEWSLLTLIVVLSGVIGLSIIKQLILPALLDLI